MINLSISSFISSRFSFMLRQSSCAASDGSCLVSQITGFVFPGSVWLGRWMSLVLQWITTDLLRLTMFSLQYAGARGVSGVTTTEAEQGGQSSSSTWNSQFLLFILICWPWEQLTLTLQKINISVKMLMQLLIIFYNHHCSSANRNGLSVNMMIFLQII